jgi:hypothetical protein
MMSILRLERLIRAGSHRRLIESVLANGRFRSGELVDRLCLGDGGEAAALGLALARCCELSYGPCPLAASIAGRLRRLQQDDGLFGRGLAASAIALRGLLQFRDHRSEAMAGQSDLPPATRRGLDALRHAIREGPGGADRLDAAVVVGWLGAHPASRGAAMLEPLNDMLGLDEPSAPVDDLERYARAAAA